ncbi:Transposase [Aliiroseovarius crassostreae]|uniref:transposase n=1 Tax=Aliiroseovarius crassostreae TaxID=154981 RepID=UPI0008E3C3D8|nr:transposase [Aliiroseovarius crassostreae]SFU98739.1 Transposase [Aliiroseovarius crassostreae]
MDGPAFAAYIREVLVPEIAPGTVVFLDNLAPHRNKEAAQALRDHGCWFLYLPPYSPDLNPIEQAYSKLKAHLRRIGARTFTEVFDTIGSICEALPSYFHLAKRSLTGVPQPTAVIE